ncbi:MAG: dienelactone hydrolase family protein [Caulobacteraceae bacterium]
MSEAYVAFEVPTEPPVIEAGRLLLPNIGGGPGPAVVICHGSGGIDGRGAFHSARLNEAGIATLEIDLWAARGTARGPAARPASPLLTLPDAYAARRYLASQPEIDADRIGVLGFSWGGVMSLLAARAPASPDSVFAAHAALYPVCWAYQGVPDLALDRLTGKPILILTGETDAYDRPGAGAALARFLRTRPGGELVRQVEYAGAGHGFDRGGRPAQIIFDPFAHQGQGGEVLMAFHAEAASAAREEVARFFAEALG